MGKKVIPYEKSFASHVLKNCVWSDKNKLLPTEVFKESHDKYYFDCTVCEHEYERTAITALKNTQCSYCAHKSLCSDSQCKMCFNNSFASHPKAKLWSPLNTSIPRNNFLGSDKKYLFNCDTCPHIFEMALKYVNNGQKCGYCYGNRLCDSNNCKMCKEKSFAGHSKAHLWSKKNNKTARHVHKGSDKKALFECNICNHEFEIQIYKLTDENGCPYCGHRSLCNKKNVIFVLTIHLLQ